MISEQDSAVISSLRFPLAVMVVAIHSYIPIEGWEYANIFSQGLGSNVAAFVMITISQVLCHIAVPTFFLISGFLFFSNFGIGSKEVWKKKLTGRATSLVIPYFLWILIYIMFLMVKDYHNVLNSGLVNWLSDKDGLNMLWSSNRWNLDRTDIFGLPAISTSPILVPLWFMRDLIVCILFSPLFWILFRRESPSFLKILGIATLSFIYFTQLSLIIPGMSGIALFYFGIGAMLSLNGQSVSSFAYKYKRLSYIVFAVLLTIEVILFGHNTYWGNVIYPFYVLSGVIFIINFVKNSNINSSKFERYTFYIFAFHIFVLPIIGSGLGKLIILITGENSINDLRFANNYPWIVVLEYLLKIAITLGISMLTYRLLERTMPKVCKILCGKRVNHFDKETKHI